MIVFLFIILLITFNNFKTAKPGQFYEDYLSKEKTAAINGLFTLLVFMRHVLGYVTISGSLDTAYQSFDRFLSQAVVSTFLFYSGFGILESIKKKKLKYVREIPLKRFFKVFYHMEIAILIFLIVGLCLKKQFSVKQILLSFVFWDSLGNSNWYIFAILALYLIVFISFLIARGNEYIGTALVCGMSVLYVYALMRAGKSTWWYNTVILYPMGMIYSLFKEKIEKVIMKNDLTYFFFAALTAVASFEFYKRRGSGIEFYSLWVMCFVMIVVLLTMKVSIGNEILNWFGSHVFSFYILQRIPMMIFKSLGYASKRYLFIILSFIVSVFLSYAFDMLLSKTDSFIYKRKK